MFSIICGGVHRTCGGNAEALQERWVSILNHVVNKHKWKNSKHFRRCEHGRLCRRKERKTKWLEDGSLAYVALKEVVLNKKFLKDIEKLTEFHTGELEVYHSLPLKYVPKCLHYSYKGMGARTQLAVIRDHKIVVCGKRLTSDTLLAIKTKSLTVKYVTYRIYSQYRKLHVETPCLTTETWRLILNDFVLK